MDTKINAMTKLAQLFDDQLACRRHPINDKKTFEQVFISNNKPNDLYVNSSIILNKRQTEN